MNRHLHKKETAVDAAKMARDFLARAEAHLVSAEIWLKQSGWSGARVGVHQANARVKSWRDKIDAELAAIKGGKL